jgi:ABC-type antimicrobial peptide transport system permease subunit
LLLTAMAIGTVATVLAAFLPARRAAKLEVAAALRENV